MSPDCNRMCVSKQLLSSVCGVAIGDVGTYMVAEAMSRK